MVSASRAPVKMGAVDASSHTLSVMKKKSQGCKKSSSRHKLGALMLTHISHFAQLISMHSLAG